MHPLHPSHPYNNGQPVLSGLGQAAKTPCSGQRRPCRSSPSLVKS
jgi:hypothetical protein